MFESFLAFAAVLVLLFAFFEVGLLAEAWISVENAARKGMEYAVTGKFDPAYCPAAARELGWPYGEADLADGTADCIIPETYASQPPFPETVKMSSRLQAQARYLSINAQAESAAIALQRRDLLKKEFGSSQPGYFRVTVCPDPNPGFNQPGDEFDFLPQNASIHSPTRCLPAESAGDALHPYLTLEVDFNHSLLSPILSSTWPVVHLSSHRHGVLNSIAIQ